MPLKHLELVGYKTFASKASFEFADSITAIVGPNGSGKSNIADSLRWVLGEQSYSLLRGKKTVDMIFAGSEQRPRAGMASATVVFDNQNGWLPIDFAEVALTRRAYRDGQNEYLINGQKVRLRDVTELLGKGGLAGHTYTIIGQGLVDAALSLKADERRKLFEEAAGIGLYRGRREEALRRLETTRRNLERVQDILAELGPRLRSLERQARRTQEYEQVKADLHLLLQEWYGYHWHTAQRELKEGREAARLQEKNLQQARALQGTFDQQMGALRERIHGLRARLNAWHRELGQFHTRRERLGRELAIAEERQRALAERSAASQTEQARLHEEHRLHQERLARASAELERLQKESGEAREQQQAIQLALQTRQQERASAARLIQDTETRLAQLAAQQARQSAQQDELARRIETLAAGRAELEQALAAAAAARRTLGGQLAAAALALQTAEHAALAARTALHTAQARATETEASRQQTLETSARHQADLARLSAQLEVLEQAEQAHAGYSAGARTLLEAAGRGELDALRTALGGQLEVPAEYETAIAAALGPYLDAVLLRGASPLLPALQRLAEANANGALLPLDSLAPPAPLHPVDDPACLGVAASLVRVSPELRPAVDLLLGNMLVVRDWETAQRLGRAGSPGAVTPSAAFVTLGGEILHPEGAVTIGGRGTSGVIARPRQKREIAGQQAALEKMILTLAAERAELEQSLAAAHAETTRLAAALEDALAAEDAAREARRAAAVHLEQAETRLGWQQEQLRGLDQQLEEANAARLENETALNGMRAQMQAAETELRRQRTHLLDIPLDDLQTQAAHWSTQFAVGERAVADARLRQEERRQALADSGERLRQLETQLAGNTSGRSQLTEEESRLRVEETELAGQIRALQTLIDPVDAELAAAEARQDQEQANETASRQALAVAERHHAQAQISFARRQEALDNLRQRIEDDFGLVAFEYVEDVAGPTPLPLGDIVQSLPLVDELSPGMEENIRRQRAQMRRMGAINPDAQREYLEVNERHNFLTAQVADLIQAEKDILEVINELDVIMEREFRTTFENVAREFKETFTRLFGGGSARLVLTDPDDLSVSGVDIEARLPGRRSQGLSLLSGGERSLTATALVFSLIKVSPTPFCVLDEVDAMLDEANVNRFAELLRELSQKTQFIIITHNRNTVQVADTIYGITMGRDSASQVLGLKLDEVADVVE